MNSRHLRFERKFWKQGILHIAGIDEAGRGPLAGPVVAAAVVFAPDVLIRAVNDSKQVLASERERLFDEIMSGALAVGIGCVDHQTIDRINILNATYAAMHQAIRSLSILPQHLLIDGNRFLPMDAGVPAIPFTTIIDGDAKSFSIAAASIIAKVTRDRLMIGYDREFPGYGFAKHKGYATEEHREAIFRLGYCPIHRRSFSVNTQIELAFSD